MAKLVAFLRAINTPPRHVKMDRLKSVFTEAGFRDVATFIASGNVIFDDPGGADPTAAIEQALGDGLGYPVSTFLRTAEEVIAVADGNPFSDLSGNIEVSFLRVAPSPGAAEALEATAAGSDRLAVVGRELYWFHIGPRTASEHSEARVVKLLGTETTQRSLRTVSRIADKYLG